MTAPHTEEVDGISPITIVGALAICWMLWSVVQSVRIAEVRDGGVILSLGCTDKNRDWLLETTSGIYPVKGRVHVEPGTPLQVETRSNGDRWLCVAGRQTCVQTTRRSLRSGQARRLSLRPPSDL